MNLALALRPRVAPAPPSVIVSDGNPTFDGSGNVLDSWWANLPLNKIVTVNGTDPDTYLGPQMPVGWIGRGTVDNNGNHVSGIFENWTGSAFDRATGRQWFFGGGHLGSMNNGLAEFQLEKMLWRFAMDPSIYSDADVAHQAASWGTGSPPSPWVWTSGYEINTFVWSDGKPTSIHTYGGLAWRPSSNEVLIQHTQHFAINVTTGTPRALTAPLPFWANDTNSFYDPTTDKWYLFRADSSDGGGYRIVDVAAGTDSSELFPSIVGLPGGFVPTTYGVHGAIIGRKIFLVADPPSDNPTGMIAWTHDLDTQVQTFVPLTGTGNPGATQNHFSCTGDYSDTTGLFYLMRNSELITTINVTTGNCNVLALDQAGAPSYPAIGSPDPQSPYTRARIYTRPNGVFHVAHYGSGFNLQVARIG